MEKKRADKGREKRRYKTMRRKSKKYSKDIYSKEQATEQRQYEKAVKQLRTIHVCTVD